MTRWIFAIILALACTSAEARFKGGHTTTFDPSQWGGSANVACLTAAIGGICNTGYNAACNGSTSDVTAISNWRTAAIAANPTTAVLYIPPGSRCVIDSGSTSLIWDGTLANAGVQNSVIWMYDATISSPNGLRLGAAGFFEDTTHEAFIQSTTIGDVSVTLVTAADSSIFSVGDWIAVTGIELQTCCGFPPNFQRYEFRQITAITGTTTKVISFSGALDFQYLSTWPSIQSDASMGNNGPAKIFKMAPSWNISHTIYGGFGIVTTFSNSQDTVQGRSVTITDFTSYAENTSASVGYNITLNRTNTSGMEIDKVITNLTMVANAVRSNLTFQSPAPINFYGTAIIVQGSLNGTPWNSQFVGGSILGLTKVGPSGYYGAGNSVAFNGTYTPTGASSLPYMTKAVMDPLYSSGTFTITKASGSYTSFVSWAVPGRKYAFADSDGTINSSPLTTFTITSLVDNGTTVSAVTDLVGNLPTPSCNATPCDAYTLYPASTITQINKPAGSADLTQYAAP